jgi:hypothetical protein
MATRSDRLDDASRDRLLLDLAATIARINVAVEAVGQQLDRVERRLSEPSRISRADRARLAPIVLSAARHFGAREFLSRELLEAVPLAIDRLRLGHLLSRAADAAADLDGFVVERAGTVDRRQVWRVRAAS